jgi:hypothetical protein
MRLRGRTLRHLVTIRKPAADPIQLSQRLQAFRAAAITIMKGGRRQ